MGKISGKLLLFGHYGLPNWGDEAILAGLIRRIDQHKWQLTVTSPFPDFVRKEHGVAAVSPPPAGIRSFFKGIFSRETRKFFNSLRAADFVLFGGGGLFQEHPPRALSIWNWYLRLCFFFRKKTLLIANSIGPFASARSERRTAALFRKISFFSVRDENSQQLLLKMGISEQKIIVASDAALLLPKRRNNKLRKGILFILRREDLHPAQMAELRKCCAALQKDQRTLVEFLPMQIPQAHDDLLAGELGIPLFRPTTLREARQKIAQANIVCTNRLHGGILSLLEQTPFFVFTSRPKITNFFQSAGLNELLMPAKFSCTGIKKKILWFKKNKKSVQTKITAAQRRERQKAAHILPDFF